MSKTFTLGSISHIINSQFPIEAGSVVESNQHVESAEINANSPNHDHLNDAEGDGERLRNNMGKINIRCDAALQSMNLLDSYIHSELENSHEEERIIRDDLKRQGIIIGVHVPEKPPQLFFDKDVMKTQFGSVVDNFVFGNIIAHNTNYESLRRTGQVAFVEPDKSSQTSMFSKTATYLNTTASANNRQNASKNKHRHKHKSIRATHAHTSAKVLPFVLSQSEIDRNRRDYELLSKMTNKLSYLRNPRYNPESAHHFQLLTSAVNVDTCDSNCFVVGNPKEIIIKDFTIGKEMIKLLTIKNFSSVSQIPKIVLESATSQSRNKSASYMNGPFFVHGIEFPSSSKDGSLAPGMSVKISIMFKPTISSPVTDCVIVSSQHGPALRINLSADINRPILKLDSIIDVGPVLIGDCKRIGFDVSNSGGSSLIRVMLAEDLLQPSQSRLTSDCVRSSPFTIYPASFSLQSNTFETVMVELVPMELGSYEREIVLLCDTGDCISFKVKGDCVLAKMDITSSVTTSEMWSSRKLSQSINIDEEEESEMDSKELIESIMFPSTTIGDESKLTIWAHNSSKINLQYRWECGSNFMSNESDFTIIPKEGEIEPFQSQSFSILFLPTSTIPAMEVVKMMICSVTSGSIDHPNNACPRSKYIRLFSWLYQKTTKVARSTAIRYSCDPESVGLVADATSDDSTSDSNEDLLEYVHIDDIGWIADFYRSEDSGDELNEVVSSFKAQLEVGKDLSKKYIDRARRLASSEEKSLQSDDSSTGSLEDSSLILLDALPTDEAKAQTEKRGEFHEGDHSHESIYDFKDPIRVSQPSVLLLPVSCVKNHDSQVVENEWEREVFLSPSMCIQMLPLTIRDALNDMVSHEAVEFLKRCYLKDVQLKEFHLVGAGCIPAMTIEPQIVRGLENIDIGKDVEITCSINNNSEVYVEIDFEDIIVNQLSEWDNKRNNHSVNELRKSCDLSITTKDRLILPGSNLDVRMNLRAFRAARTLELFLPFKVMSLHSCRTAEAFSADGNAVANRDIKTASYRKCVDSMHMTIVASVAPPRVRFSEVEVDFGVIGVGTEEERSIMLQNTAAVPVQFSCWIQASDSDLDNDISRISGFFEQENDDKSDSYSEATTSSRDSYGIDIPLCKLYVEPMNGLIAGNGAQMLKLRCQTGKMPQMYNGVLCCRAVESVYGQCPAEQECVGIHAFVQPSLAMASTNIVSFGCVYVGIPVVRKCQIINLSHLPTRCKIECPGGFETSSVRLLVEPIKSQIEGKGQVDIVVTLTALKAGDISQLLGCRIFGFPSVIPIKLEGSAHPLSIELFHLEPGSIIAPLAHPTAVQYEGEMPEKNDPGIINLGEAVNLFDRRMNIIAIRNMTPIACSIDISILKFNICNAKAISECLFTEKNSHVMTDNEDKYLNTFHSNAGRKKMETQHLRQQDEKLLKSSKGLVICADTNSFSLPPWGVRTVKLIAVNNTSGVFEDKIIINAAEIDEVANRKMTDSKEYGMSMKVIGCPVQIRSDTYRMTKLANIPFPVLNLGVVSEIAKTVEAGLKVKNLSSVPMQVRWQVEDCDEKEAGMTKIEKIDDNFVVAKLMLLGDALDAINSETRRGYRIGYSADSGDYCNFKLIWSEDLKKPSKFSVKPSEDTVLPYKEASFVVAYDNQSCKLTEGGEYVRLIGIVKQASTAKSLLSDANSAMTMNITAIACVDKSSFHIDIRPADEDSDGESDDPRTNNARINFRMLADEIFRGKNSFGRICQKVKSLKLRNTSKSSNMVRITMDGPFKLVSSSAPISSSDSESSSEIRFVAFEEESLEIGYCPIIRDLKKKMSNSSEEINNETRCEAFVKEIGHIKIQWEPEDANIIPLTATIFRPLLAIAPCFYDFGVIKTEDLAITTLVISSLSRATASWSVRVATDEKNPAHLVDDPSVFAFSQTSGIISHGPTRLPNDHLEQSKLPHDVISSDPSSRVIIGRQEPSVIQATFRPKTDARYRTKFYFDVESGESFSICLIGKGTFEEN